MNVPGRNDPCHCGSGKKYKKCCLEKDELAAQLSRNAVAEEPAVESPVIFEKPVFVEKLSEDYDEDDHNKEPIVLEENENITKLWDTVNNLDVDEDTDEIMSIFETFIKDFPDLAGESDLVDVLFEIEEQLYKLGQHGKYVALLEKIQKYAPEFYRAEAGWFDTPRIYYSIANRQFDKIEPLLVNFKEDPVEHYDNLNHVIDILAWIGSEKELLDLVLATHKQLTDSDKIFNAHVIPEWIYLDIYHKAANSELPLDSCVDMVKKSTQEIFGELEPDEDTESLSDNIKEYLSWIREDTVDWKCPYGKNKELVNFFSTMGVKLTKHIQKVSNCNVVQARFIQLQLYRFWMNYRNEKRPKDSVYFITNQRISDNFNHTDELNTVAFLQAVWYFCDFLFVHGQIDDERRKCFQEHCASLYQKKCASNYRFYPAKELITEFPEMYCRV